MRRAAAVFAAALACASSAAAQNAKENCAEASERAQKLVDSRRLLEARNAFITCAQDSCPAAVRRDCQAELEDVKRNIPSVIIRVKAPDGADVPQGEVSLDGIRIGVLDGQDLELHPGTHAIHVALPDGRSFDRQVIVAPGEKSREVVFDARGETPAPAAAAHEPATRWTTVRTIGFVSTIVGATALVAGGVFLTVALLQDSNAQTLQSRATNSGFVCTFGLRVPTGNTDCDNAIQDKQSALSTETLSLVLGITGGVALIGGLVMFFVGGNEPRASALHVIPLVGPRFAGLSLGGSF